jgi:hypothetical protein
MATGGGRISLPLAVGVDHGHLQAAGGGSWPPPVAESIFFFFFFGCSPERQKWPLGAAGSPSPGYWGGSQPPPVAGSIFFIFYFQVGKVTGGGQ